VNLENAELLSDINVCHVEVNVISAPAFSNDDAGPCTNPDLGIDEVTHSVEGDSER